MTYGKAISMLESETQETVEASLMLEAIDKILSMATINSVNKNALLSAVRFLRKRVNELLKEQELKEPTQEAQRDYEAASDMRDYCERYEPTYNPDDGSM